ncbi:hypothetical protein HR12_46800, partial [Microbacterium sp. SUBG005]
EPAEHKRLACVGSIMRLTAPGDVVWGSGINGKTMSLGAAPDLDVRAVRGPRTAEALREAGVSVPTVFGDPALLWARWWPRKSYLDGEVLTPVSVVPNHNERSSFRGPNVIDPLGEPHEIIGRIARSEFVCGSSLHGIVLAEALGIPARLVRSTAEPAFKYDDYYGGTGRVNYSAASSVEEAIAMGGETPPIFDDASLLEAFPADLWHEDT